MTGVRERLGRRAFVGLVIGAGALAVVVGGGRVKGNAFGRAGASESSVVDRAAVRQAIGSYLDSLAAHNLNSLERLLDQPDTSAAQGQAAERLAAYGGIPASQIGVEYLDQAVPDVIVVKLTRPPQYSSTPEMVMFMRDSRQAWRITLTDLSSPEPSAPPLQNPFPSQVPT